MAKQLNDDAHDFEEDLQKGFMTPVVAKLLENFKKKSQSGTKPIPVRQLTKSLREIFWYEVLDVVAGDIFNHISLARKTLAEIEVVKNHEILDNLLLPLETSSQKALEQRDQTVDFLRTYRR